MSIPNGSGLGSTLVDISSAGDNVIIPALSGGIFILRVVLSLASQTTVQFKTDQRTLSGPMYLDALGLGYSNQPYFAIGPDEQFIITLGDSVQTGGTIWYQRGPL